jgi:hypothetical protein
MWPVPPQSRVRIAETRLGEAPDLQLGSLKEVSLRDVLIRNAKPLDSAMHSA